eukprot:5669043-Pyramimonas_sp.AAC.1
MQGGSFSKYGFRPGTAHIRLKSSQQLHGWSVARFQNVTRALAPRNVVLKAHSSFKNRTVEVPGM